VSHVHCLECGGQVVVDPRGQCPDGHTVGTPGNRIEMAMGHEAAHPDEPQPWVYRIDPAEVDADARQSASGPRLRVAEASTNGTGPAREARPVRAPGIPQDGADDEPTDSESLLRELHSLAALDDALTQRNGAGDGHARQGPPAIPATPPPPPVQAAAPTPRPPRGDREEIADAFAELSALDVPASTANGQRPTGVAPTPPAAGDAGGAAAGTTPPSPPNGRSDADRGAAAEGLASLFGDGPLFAQDDEPGTAVTDGGVEAGAQPPAPSAPATSAEVPGSGEAPPTEDEVTGLEFEAMLQAADPQPVAPDTRRATPRSPSEDGPSSDTDTAHEVPKAVELRRRRSTAPAPRDEGAAADPQPVHAAVGSAQVLDLSSFTAKGGPGAGRSTGRRRRFGR